MSAQGKLRKTESGYAAFCPGCKEYHIFDSRWSFNGDFDAPSFNPSFLAWTNGDSDPEWNIPASRCHSFVVNGEWRFLEDCTHGLKGSVQPMRNETTGWNFED